ncbi:MAG: hypothetical protein JNL80_01390 [Phycisphaerae bacterium]|nr:hypothetical protein [Phycisphaerae bacterium]
MARQEADLLTARRALAVSCWLRRAIAFDLGVAALGFLCMVLFVVTWGDQFGAPITTYERFAGVLASTAALTSAVLHWKVIALGLLWCVMATAVQRALPHGGSGWWRAVAALGGAGTAVGVLAAVLNLWPRVGGGSIGPFLAYATDALLIGTQAAALVGTAHVWRSELVGPAERRGRVGVTVFALFAIAALVAIGSRFAMPRLVTHLAKSATWETMRFVYLAYGFVQCLPAALLGIVALRSAWALRDARGTGTGQGPDVTGSRPRHQLVGIGLVILALVIAFALTVAGEMRPLMAVVEPQLLGIAATVGCIAMRLLLILGIWRTSLMQRGNGPAAFAVVAIGVDIVFHVALGTDRTRELSWSGSLEAFGITLSVASGIGLCLWFSQQVERHGLRWMWLVPVMAATLLALPATMVGLQVSELVGTSGPLASTFVRRLHGGLGAAGADRGWIVEVLAQAWQVPIALGTVGLWIAAMRGGRPRNNGRSDQDEPHIAHPSPHA